MNTKFCQNGVIVGAPDSGAIISGLVEAGTHHLIPLPFNGTFNQARLAPHEEAKSLNEFSELLLFHVVLSNGCVSPFPGGRTMVYTSSVHPDAHRVLRVAENKFHDWHEYSLIEDRKQLVVLEGLLKVMKTKPSSELLALREKCARIPNVTWRDHDAHRSTLVEMLKRSAYRAMSYVDEGGARLAASYVNPARMANDASWVALTDRDNNEVALIRASSTGGACIHSLAGVESPTFNYFCSTKPEVLEEVSERISKKHHMSALRGHSLVLSVAEPSGRGTVYTSDELFLALKLVFAMGAEPTKKVKVEFEDEALEKEWREFFTQDVTHYYGRQPTDAAAKVLANMPASPRTLALLASRAVMTKVVLNKVTDPGVVDWNSNKTVTLTREHLNLAKQFAHSAFWVSPPIAHLETRSNNAIKAREAFKSPARIVKAEQALYDAITLAPDRKISHKAAIRTPGVTAGLLELLVARDHRFVELKGTENIRMGKTTRAYMLKADVRMDPAEAVAEFEEAAAEWDEHGAESVDESDVRREFKTLQDLATKRRYKADGSINYAAVPIDEMTPKQIRLVPAIASMFADEVCLRGTRENPEPDFLLEADEDDPAAFTKGIPNLWFRYNDKLEDQHNWSVAWKLGFAEAWGKPLGQQDTENTSRVA